MGDRLVLVVCFRRCYPEALLLQEFLVLWERRTVEGGTQSGLEGQRLLGFQIRSVMPRPRSR